MAVRSMPLVPMTLRVMRAHVLVAEARRIARECSAQRDYLHTDEGEQQDKATQAGTVTHDESV